MFLNQALIRHQLTVQLAEPPLCRRIRHAQDAPAVRTHEPVYDIERHPLRRKYLQYRQYCQ